MTEEGLPIEIEGHTYLFRLEDGDAKEIERTLSLFVAFHPINMTYENAALFLQHGLRKRGPDGKLVYIFQQDEAGKDDAFMYVKKFCRNFSRMDGIFALYGYFNRALVAIEWYGEPEKDKDMKEVAEKLEEWANGDKPKN